MSVLLAAFASGARIRAACGDATCPHLAPLEVRQTHLAGTACAVTRDMGGLARSQEVSRASKASKAWRALATGFWSLAGVTA